MRNDYKIVDDYVTIYLNCKGSTVECLIDLEDLDKVAQYRWYGSKGKTGNIYAMTPGNQKIQMHRLLMGNPKGLIDHKDNNSLNNRRNNLRVTTSRINALNMRRSRANSGLRGVYWHEHSGKWHAQCSGVCLGYYTDKYEAGRAIVRYIMSIDSLSAPRVSIYLK